MKTGHSIGPEYVRIHQKAFLAAYKVCGTLTHAAKAAHVGIHSHYRWLENDPQYAEQFDEAKAAYCDLIRKEIARRAIEGVPKYRFYRGRPIIDPRTGKPYYECEYSDQLLLALAKSRMPSEFRERSEVKQNVEFNNVTPLRTTGPEALSRLRTALAQLAAEDAEQTEGTGRDVGKPNPDDRGAIEHDDQP